jgi:hypothetical protein
MKKVKKNERKEGKLLTNKKHVIIKKTRYIT